MKKKVLIAALLCLVCFVFSGCGVEIGTGSGLYKLPEVAKDYVNLQTRTEEILATGAEYSAPLTGTNRQSVQLVDLNADGVEEAVAFFKNDAEEKPLKVYIFALFGESYNTVAIIEADGTAFDTIEYVQLDGEGFLEILLGTRINSETPQVMNVYAIDGYYTDLVGQITYTGYTLCDLNSDNRSEIVAASYSGAAQTGKAVCYAYQDDCVVNLGETALSEGIMAIKAIKTGKLSDGEPAVFLTSQFSTGENITDIIAINRGQMRNITLNPRLRYSAATVVGSALPAEDINGDGITEMPSPTPVTDAGSGESVDGCYQVVWNAYNSRGKAMKIMTTFHNVTDGWYVDITDYFDGTLTVCRSTVNYGTRCTMLYDGGDGHELLRIYALTGDNRYSRLNSTGSFLLTVKDVTVYSGKVADHRGLSEEEAKDALTARFALSRNAWYTGEVNR